MVKCVHQVLYITVVKVELKRTENVQVRPGVQIKGYLQLLFVNYSVFVQEIEETIEYLKLLHLEMETLIDHGSLSDLIVTAFHLSQVLSISTTDYFTILTGIF